MKLTTLVCGLAALASSVFGLSVTGPPGSGVRQEIRTLAKNSKAFDLFILAMDKYQKLPTSQQTSYYQIAGIHGVPNVNFDGVAQCASCHQSSDGGPFGYCTHDSILFLGWHRAYLALFEQQLVSIAKGIANTYPQSTRSQYVSAANTLRLPYWDWAARPPSGSNLPTQLTQKSISVTGPTGPKSMANPLYQFTFTDPRPLLFGTYNTWQHTLRYPQSNAATAGSNEARAIAAFNNIRGSLQDQLFQIFSTCDTFQEVGLDDASTGTNKCSNSLEALHNTVHSTAGGPNSKGAKAGHMTILPTAAFDPLFWLHHANIDRLFAMWQTVNPQSYSGSQRAPSATWTIPQGSTQTLNSPLTPFHKGGGGFWTTVGVRRWQNLGYTYPEFANSDGSAGAIAKYINNLYGPNARSTAGSSKRDAIGDVVTPLVAGNGSLFQYVANINTPRYTLGGSYYIYLFNGAPASEEPSDWLLDPNLIGPMGIMSTTTMTQNDLIASGSIPLTRTLSDVVSGGLIPDLTEAVVVPYLTKNMQWRVQGPDGTEIDPKTIDGFDIQVFASTASQVSDSELPTWSEFINLADVVNPALRAGASASASASVSASASASAVASGSASAPAASGSASATPNAATTDKPAPNSANANTASADVTPAAATPAPSGSPDSDSSDTLQPAILRRRPVRF